MVVDLLSILLATAIAASQIQIIAIKWDAEDAGLLKAVTVS